MVPLMFTLTNKNIRYPGFVANKGHVKPPYVGTDKGQEDDELTDQVDPESQDSFGQLDSNWLKSGTPPQ